MSWGMSRGRNMNAAAPVSGKLARFLSNGNQNNRAREGHGKTAPPRGKVRDSQRPRR